MASVFAEQPRLVGARLSLEPMKYEHLPELCRVGLRPELWSLSPNEMVDAEDMSRYVATAINGREDGHILPYVTTLRETGEIVGSTRLANVVMNHRRAEIGWTWILPAWQRTFVNTEAKLLLLSLGFEQLGFNRIELKTDVLNTRSRDAILRIGAKEEGVFRQHVVTGSGRIRDTIYFSIVKEEWPDVKRHLKDRLARDS